MLSLYDWLAATFMQHRLSRSAQSQYRDRQCSKRQGSDRQGSKRQDRGLRLALTLTVTASLAALLQACGGSSSSGSDTQPSADPLNFEQLQRLPTESAMLRAAGSSEALYEAVVSGDADAARGALPVMAFEADTATTSAGSSSAYTGTYTLEAGVDELDLVKYNGEHLYVAGREPDACCVAWPLDGVVDIDAVAADQLNTPAAGSSSEATIRVLATDPATATATLVDTITLADSGQSQGLYLHDSTLVSLNTSAFYGVYGARFADYQNWHQQYVDLHFIDTEAGSSAQQHPRLRIDGGFVQSRRVGDTIYLVSRHTPYLPVPYEDAGSSSQRLEHDAEQLVPQLNFAGESRDLFDPAACYIRNEGAELVEQMPDYAESGKGALVLTSITAIPIDDPTSYSSVCYNQYSSGVYVSEQAVYLFEPLYDTETNTAVHKFSLFEQGPAYRGSALVRGDLWLGGQRDFRVSEYAGHLRLVTTRYTSDPTDREDHYLSVLEDDNSKLALQTVATLPNAERPDELGKPNESLFAVRFQGSRAYLVTFERIDPLYVLDLSDPADPLIAGQLEIAGVSEFLHPVGDSLLLAAGWAEQPFSSALKLELFDVTDMARPLSLGAELIGDGSDGANSEAIYDRHAFSYLARSGQTDRFALPVTRNVISPDNDNQPVTERRRELRLYELQRGDDESLLASINFVGALAAEREGLSHYYDGDRAVLHDDAVYYVSDQQVWSALWGNLSAVAGPQ